MAESQDHKQVEPAQAVGRSSRSQQPEVAELAPTWANDGLTAVLEHPPATTAPPRPRPELTPAMIMHLQRTSGNAAVEALLSARRRPPVQRCPDHSCGGNCSHTGAQEQSEGEPTPVQRVGVTDVLPLGVALIDRLSAPRKATAAGPNGGKAASSTPDGAPTNGHKPELNAKADTLPKVEGEMKAPSEGKPEVAIGSAAQVKPGQELGATAPNPEPSAQPPQAVPPGQPPHAAPSGQPPRPPHGSGPLGLLQALGSTPTSVMGAALGRTRESAGLAQVLEVASLAASLPRIAQPTGLPAISEPKPAPATTIAEGKIPEQKPPAEGSAPQPESEDEAPKVALRGEANPALNASYHAETDQAVSSKQAEAATAVGAEFGEQNIAPTLQPATLTPAHRPGAPEAVPPGAAPVPPPIPEEDRKAFDRESAPWLKEQVAQQVAQRQEQEAIYAKTTADVKKTGDRELEEETTKARADQQKVREEAHSGVEAERSQWRQENQKITDTYQQQATSKRREIDEQINTTVQTADSEAGQKLTDAKAKAEQERQAAEAKAAQAKKDAEAKPQSWWDKAKGAVSGAFDAVKGAVSGIFDALRSVVKGIIDLAKRAAHAIIDTARALVVGMIQTFGTVLKGLVTVALAAFPAVAARIRARIDEVVNGAVTRVNQMAEALKQRADAILDAVAKRLDAALRVLQTGCIAILSGLEKLATLPFDAIGAIAHFIEMLKPWERLLEGGKKLEEAASSVIAQIQAALGAMIAQVPDKVDQAVQFAINQVGGPAKKHLAGIWRHLKKGLAYLKENWWTEIKKTAWNLVWPWPAVWKDLQQIWTEIKAAKTLAFKLEFSQTINHGLKIIQTLNGIAGNLYGWFFIGSVLVGTIIGAFFGGAGAIPGALAGMAIAAEVGEGLLASLIATETAVIAKGVYDLAFGSDKADDQEDAYDRIAGSGLTLGVTGALMVLGEIAADIAKSVFDAVVDLIKGEKPAIEVPIESGAKAEPGGGDTSGEAKPTPAGEQRVLAEQPTADGEHEIKVTEDGACLICSTCEEVRIEYGDELKRNPNLDTELKEANTLADPAEKAKRVAEIEQKLSDVRAERNAQVKNLELDPDKGRVTPASQAEARDALDLQDKGDVPGPVRRANGKVTPNEAGADFVDGTGKLWDHKLAVSGPDWDAGEFLKKLEINDLRNGEDIMLNHQQLSPGDLTDLLKAIDAKGLRPRFKFIPPLPVP